ncbi:MAG: type III polyketide synthase [Candidatus Melainabacteria bacterium]|nr:type III polyketide synthase [Candidatus Melainabacteria bacterium]
MPSSIIGLGTALPASLVSQSDALALARDLCCKTTRQAKVLEQVYLKSGVQTRSTVLQAEIEPRVTNFFQPPTTAGDAGPSTAQRMALYELQAGPLATTACRAALHHAKIDAKAITHLVTVSCTGFVAPGFDLQLFKTLPLNPTVQRTHIGFMGCHGALNALRVGHGYCAEDPNNVVLICATELCSMHFQYGWSREILVSNALFADGSAALIMSNDQDKPADLHGSQLFSAATYSHAASYVVPESEAAMSWRIGDSGFIMSLANNVPDQIQTNLPPFIESWLAKNNLSVTDIKGWAVHPGGPRILDAVGEALQLEIDALSASRQILSECGNMSSPTVLFILQRLLALGDKLPCVVLGFGPGLTIEAALIR